MGDSKVLSHTIFVDLLRKWRAGVSRLCRCSRRSRKTDRELYRRPLICFDAAGVRRSASTRGCGIAGHAALGAGRAPAGDFRRPRRGLASAAAGEVGGGTGGMRDERYIELSVRCEVLIARHRNRSSVPPGSGPSGSCARGQRRRHVALASFSRGSPVILPDRVVRVAITGVLLARRKRRQGGHLTCLSPQWGC